MLRKTSQSIVAVALMAAALNGCKSKVSKVGSRLPGLEDFVAGTGAVRLRMTEDQVRNALGAEPVQRRENARVVDTAYTLAGSPAGSAHARFVGGPLVLIEFFRDTTSEAPKISEAVADKIVQGPLAMKAVKYVLNPSNPLTMPEMLDVTGVPAYRIGWSLHTGDDGVQSVTTETWAWAIEGTGKALLVASTEGVLDQPAIRPLGNK